MPRIPDLRRVFRIPDHKGAIDADVDRELRFHIDSRIEELLAEGQSPAEARAIALAEFGDVEPVRRTLLRMVAEQSEETHRAELLGDLRQDVGFAIRSLRKNIGFASAAILTLALGVGATTAIFSVVSAVLLQSLPFERPDRLVRLWSADTARGHLQAAVSIPDFADWRDQNTSFESMAAYSTLAAGLILTGRGEPVRLRTAWVTEDFFRTMGMRIGHGRPILPSEHAPGENRVAVISHRVWRERFGGDSSLVGATIQLDGSPFTVVGIADPGARFPAGDVELWTPLSLVPETSIPRFRFVRWLAVIGRLREGLPVARGEEEMKTIAARLAREHAEANSSFASVTVRPLRDHIVGDVRGGLLVLFGAVAFVLVIGIVNVANLMLARASTRSREIAVRAALGAGRGRIARQLLTESMILALIGGALGALLAWWGVSALLALGAEYVPSAIDVRVDGWVLGFALAISLIAGVGFGLVPAVRSTSPHLAMALREGGRGDLGSARAHRLRSVLVAAEVALAVTLVIGAGLMARSFARLVGVDPGFVADDVLVARFTIPPTRYQGRERFLPIYDRILEEVRAIPGVASAGAIKEVPLRGMGEYVPYVIPGRPAPRPGEEPRLQALPTSDGYFATMRIPIRAGRDFLPQDTASGTPGIIVSETFARKWWPDRSAVGEEVQFLGGPIPLRIVGVVGDVRSEALDTDPRDAIYVPVRIMARVVVSLVARTTGDPMAFAPAVREAIHSVDAQLPIDETAPMSEIVGEAATAQRFLATLLVLFAGIAVILAAIGSYGLVAYVVTQRTPEIGVRVALGASRGEVVRLMLRRGLAPVAAGLVLGITGALATRHVLATLLYGISPADPSTYVGVAAFLAVVGLIAAWIPARRAAKVEPVVALRG